MGIGAPTLKLHDQAFLLDFSLRCIDALALDDVWTSGASAKDTGAVQVGRELSDHLELISGLAPETSEIMLRVRFDLNELWSQWAGRRALSKDDVATLDRWVQERGGGLGEAALDAIAWLEKELPEERHLLLESIEALKATDESDGDIRKITKTFLAFAAGAALVAVSAAVGAALVGPAAAAAALLAVKDLAVAAFGIAATGAVGTVVLPPGQPPSQPPSPA